MAKKATKTTSEINTVSQTKRRLSKSFHIEGFGKANVGDEVTQEMRERWDEFQQKCQSNININDYTS